MNWYKSLFVARETKLERALRKRLAVLLQPYRQWKRNLRKRHRWLFETLSSIFFLPLILAYIAIGALGLVEVVTARNSDTGKGIMYPYYSQYWDAMGGIARFDKEGFYEVWYWTAGVSLLFGLFLLYALLKRDKDMAYADEQPAASEPLPDPSQMKELDALGELNDIMHVLYEVYPRPLEEWAEEIGSGSDTSANYVLWRRIANVYKRLEGHCESLEEKAAMFWALRLYVEGTKRPGKILRVLQKDGHQLSAARIREIIAEYEAERDRLFLRV